MISEINFRNFDNSTPEGQMLLAAMAILTSIEPKDIHEGKFGGMCHPQDVFEKVLDLANRIYYEEEYKTYLKSKERDSKLNSIIN